MRHPCPTLLFDICVADAYGMPYEFNADPILCATNHGRSFVRSQRHEMRMARYTDDGQMSIGVTEALLGQGRVTENIFTYWFLECFRRDPRPGYSSGFYLFLNAIVHDPKTGNLLPEITSGEIRKFREQIRALSTKNGGAMRSVPLGVIPSPSKVLDITQMQASLTHNTDSGILAAQAVALMSHFAFYEADDFRDLRAFLKTHLPAFRPLDIPTVGPIPSEGLPTAAAVYKLLASCHNRMEVLVKAVELGGDTDSVAAIAFGIASILWRDPLPPGLKDGLDEPLFGKVYLLDLGRRLMKAFA